MECLSTLVVLQITWQINNNCDSFAYPYLHANQCHWAYCTLNILCLYFYLHILLQNQNTQLLSAHVDRLHKFNILLICLFLRFFHLLHQITTNQRVNVRAPLQWSPPPSMKQQINATPPSFSHPCPSCHIIINPSHHTTIPWRCCCAVCLSV